MPVTLLLDVEIQANDGKQRTQTITVPLSDTVDPDWAFECLRFVLNSETEVESIWAKNLRPLPDPSKISGKLPTNLTIDLTNDIAPYFDITNTRTSWHAICNLLRNARIHLARAAAYKSIETQLNTNVQDFRPDWKFDDLLQTTTKVYNQYLKVLERLSLLPTFFK
jgi:hypothetical protein